MTRLINRRALIDEVVEVPTRQELDLMDHGDRHMEGIIPILAWNSALPEVLICQDLRFIGEGQDRQITDQVLDVLPPIGIGSVVDLPEDESRDHGLVGRQPLPEFLGLALAVRSPSIERGTRNGRIDINPLHGWLSSETIVGFRQDARPSPTASIPAYVPGIRVRFPFAPPHGT